MIYRILFVIFFLAQSNLFCQKNNFTLNSAIDYALKNNFNSKKLELERQITYEKTNEILSMGFPKINGSIAFQHNFSIPTSLLPGEILGRPGEYIPVKFGSTQVGDAKLSFQQLIFDSKYLIGVKARNSLKSFSNNQLKINHLNIKETITKLYFQYLVFDKILEMLIENKKVIEKLYKDTKETYKHGLIEKMDVERLEVNVKTLDISIEQFKAQKEILNLAIKYNLGYSLDSNITLRGNDSIMFSEALNNYKNLKYNITNRTEYNLLNDLKSLRHYDMKQIKSENLPSVYGSANYGFNSSQNVFNVFGKNNSWYNYSNVGIMLNVPIFDGMTRKYKLNQANLTLKKAELDLQEFVMTSQMQSSQDYINFTTSLDEYKNETNLLEIYYKMHKKIGIKFKEGIGSSFEFSASHKDYILQQIKLYEVKIKVFTNYINLKKSFGQL